MYALRGLGKLLRRPFLRFVFLVALLVLEEFIDNGDQLFWVYGFLQIEIGKRLSSLEGFCHITRNHHNGHAGVIFGSLHNRSSIGVAKTPVCNYRVVSIVAQLFYSIASRGTGSDGVAGRFQDGTLQSYNVGLIIHTEDVCHTDPCTAVGRAQEKGRLTPTPVILGYALECVNSGTLAGSS
jgi:hypothetical protein